MIIIGGDNEYRDEDEEEQVVISRWARRKVASQFDLSFSWNKVHREIHEKALKLPTTSTLVRKNRSSSMCQNQNRHQHQTRYGLCLFSTFEICYVFVKGDESHW